MRLELNEKKYYCQDIHKGVCVFGYYLKMTADGRMLILPSKRVVHNMMNRLRIFFLRGNEDKIYRLKNKEHFRDSMNSYFGMFRHCSAYKFRKKVAALVAASGWSDIIEPKPDFTHFGIVKSYTKKSYLTHKNKSFKHQILHYYDTRQNQCA